MRTETRNKVNRGEFELQLPNDDDLKQSYLRFHYTYRVEVTDYSVVGNGVEGGK